MALVLGGFFQFIFPIEFLLKVLYAIFFTVLKPKNTIIHLQVCRKNAKFTYLFLQKQCYIQLFCFEICVPCQNVCFCFGLCDSTHCLFTQIVFRHARLPVSRKLSSIEDANSPFILSTHVSAALNSRACYSRMDSDWVSMILSFIS